MKVGAEDKKKQIAAGVLGVLALGLVGYNLFGGSSSAPPPAPTKTVYVGANGAAVSGPAAMKVGTTSAQLDPSLHEEAMLRTESLVYTGNGRNIFAAGSVAPAVAIPIPVATARKIAEVKGPPPPPPTPPGPPPLPQIPLKFFGTDTAMNGTRRAFLLNGDDVYVASEGDVVERRYRVISISLASVMIEDIPNNNKQPVAMTPMP